MARSQSPAVGPDADSAHAVVLGQLGGLVADPPDEQRARAVEALHEVVREHETGEGVLVGSAAWLVTARSSRSRHTSAWVGAVRPNRGTTSD